MPNITLTKLFAPGWEKTFSDWTSTLQELKGWICEDCLTPYHYHYHKTIEAEVRVGTPLDEAKDIARLEAEWCVPDNLLKLDPEEQVAHLLDTPCGVEFIAEDDENNLS